MSIKKMLVAIDGSKSSLYAAEKATELAKISSAELYAIYVIPQRLGTAILAILLLHQDYSLASSMNLEK